jgi:hypothetical protein
MAFGRIYKCLVYAFNVLIGAKLIIATAKNKK